MTSFILSKTFFYFQQENCTYSLLSSLHFYRTYMQLGLKQSLSILLCSGLVFGSIPGFISSSSFYNIVHLFSVLMQIPLYCLSCECVMRLLILCPLPRPLLQLHFFWFLVHSHCVYCSWPPVFLGFISAIVDS